ARRRLAVQLSLAVRARLDRLKVAGVHAVQPAMLQTFTRRFVTLITWIIGGAFTYGWLVFALERLPYTRPWGRELEHHLVDLLKFVGLAIVGAIPGLVLVAVIVLITRGVQQAGAFFFDRVEGGQIRIGWLDADTAKPTRRIAMLVLWLFALAMAYPYLPGANTDAFKGLSVLVGLMISIGASSLVGQAFSGLILMYSRALRVGEFVRIGDAEGTVTELGLFATRVRTGMGEELVMPNAVVIGQVTRNYSRTVQGTGFVLHTTVTIGYDAPWRQVHAMLLEAATRTRGVLSTPAPLVLQTALSDYYVEYRLVATAGPEAPRLRAEAMSALHANIQDVFNEHGVQIMSPHYMEDPARAKEVPPEDWYPPPAKPPTPHET
ncbi:MAG: mechanosensitive ion channel, partial [Burkholderiales bacterium]|nr:mechanosensitive ion channel [Burkholderiales bacterium]